MCLACSRLSPARRVPFSFQPSQRSRGLMSSTSIAAVKQVDPAAAAELSEAGWTYLDVRTPEEFAAGHAPGAVNIPLMFKGPQGMSPNPDFMDEVRSQFPDVEQQLLVSCKAGTRSAKASSLLQQTYPNLADATKGWDGWVAANLPSTE
eukprot:jgi/Chrzof1/3319/Cz12g20230.t1